jgi:hypothetical protein
MKINSTIKPGKSSSLGGFITGILFLIFGIVLYSAVIGDSDEAAVPVSVFFLVWTIGVFIMVIYFGRNLFGKKGLPAVEIECDVEKESADEQKPESAMERLRNLEDLKEANLITGDEYKQKREEILKSI